MCVTLESSWRNDRLIICNQGIFKFAAILNAVMLVTIFFGLPETLYVRSRTNLRISDKPLDDVHLAKKTYMKRLALWSNHPELHLKANQFVLPAFKVRSDIRA